MHGINYDFDCYEGMRIAISKSKNSGVDVKMKMGSELIEKLDQMFKFYYLEYGRLDGNTHLGAIYEDLITLLGLPNEWYLAQTRH